MAAAADIVINDATPVAHTWSPSRKDGSMVVYEERTTPATSAGFYQLNISQSVPKPSSTVIRTKVTLALPLEVYSSATSTYSYPDTARFILDVLHPVTMSATQRANLYAYLKNLMAHATIQALVKDLSAPF